ncbi:unnamed protein product [Gongylonema pulchrum]|uniref:Uncharacterized protein n=1 Tax=Gongylonema pulchrum TaxID=637853 RepID=A0A183ESQ8_9BILA|nr:unnamed protein product [Gongylonema pulchrum]
MHLSGLDVAVYGFRRNKRKVEEAGISYELGIIRDKLALGLSTEPVLKQQTRGNCLLSNMKDVELENDDEVRILFFVFSGNSLKKKKKKIKILFSCSFATRIDTIRQKFRPEIAVRPIPVFFFLEENENGSFLTSLS